MQILLQRGPSVMVKLNSFFVLQSGASGVTKWGRLQSGATFIIKWGSYYKEVQYRRQMRETAKGNRF